MCNFCAPSIPVPFTESSRVSLDSQHPDALARIQTLESRADDAADRAAADPFALLEDLAGADARAPSDAPALAGAIQPARQPPDDAWDNWRPQEHWGGQPPAPALLPRTTSVTYSTEWNGPSGAWQRPSQAELAQWMAQGWQP